MSLKMIHSCEVTVTCCDKFRMWIYFLVIILFSPFIIFLDMLCYFISNLMSKVVSFLNWYTGKNANCLSCIIKILLFPFFLLIFAIITISSILLGAASIIFVFPVYLYRNFKQFKIVMKFWSKKKSNFQLTQQR